MSVTNHLQRAATHLSGVKFVSLATCGPETTSQVVKVFQDTFSPHCHVSESVLSDIRHRKERKTEILQHEGRDVGCIVYKRDLSNAFVREGMYTCLEVGLLALFDVRQDSSKGYRTLLLQRVEEAAAIALADGIACPLPKSMEENIDFFEKKGFHYKDLSSQECLVYKRLHTKRKAERDPEPEEKESRPIQSAAKEQKVETPQTPVATSTPTKVTPPTPTTPMNRTPIHLAPGVHQLTLKKQYIDPIRRGVKSVEGRINSGAPARFQVGDKIRFFCGPDDVICTITKIEKFVSFRDMLMATDFKKCIPEARTLEDAVRVYDMIPSFPERARQSGVLALHLVPAPK